MAVQSTDDQGRQHSHTRLQAEFCKISIYSSTIQKSRTLKTRTGYFSFKENSPLAHTLHHVQSPQMTLLRGRKAGTPASDPNVGFDFRPRETSSVSEHQELAQGWAVILPG